MVSKSFKDVFKKIEKTIAQSRNQALNKAATSTRTLYAKEIGVQTGLPATRIKMRAQIFKPTEARPQFALSIGVHYPFKAHDFKPRLVKVSGSKRKGASYQVKSQPRVVVPGGFIAKGKNSGKDLIFKRVGDGRYPIKTVEVDVFRPLVEAMVPRLQRHMVESFEKNFTGQLRYNLSK